MNAIIACIVYTTEAIFWYFVLTARNKDLLNPFAVSEVTFMLGCALSQLNISNILSKWVPLTHISVHIFAYTIILTGIIFIPKTHSFCYEKCIIHIEKTFIIAARLFFVVVIICAFIEWAANDFVITILGTAFDRKSVWKAVTGVHYGVTALPYAALIAIYELIYRKNVRKATKLYNLFVLLLSTSYILCLQVSRGTFLIIFLGGVLIFHSKHYIKFHKLVLLGGFLILAMLVFMIVRVPSRESNLYTSLGSYHWWGSGYMYIATCFDNLNTLIREGSPLTICYASLIKPIADSLHINVEIEYVEYQYLFYNAKTILYPFYHDLGVLGVFLYPAAIYSLIGYIYRKAFYDSRYVLILALLQKAIYITFFGNYFFTLLAVMFPIIIIWLMCFYAGIPYINRAAMVTKG